MSKHVLIVSPALIMVGDPKKDEREEKFTRKNLKSASERLRVPTPAERLLKD